MCFQRLASLLCVFAGWTAVPAWAELPRLIPREILFGNPERAHPNISPDGKLLAYLAPRDGVLNIWVRTPGRTDDYPVTADKTSGIRFFAWRPGHVSRHLLYIQDFNGDENWHLYQADLYDRTTRDLTPYKGVQAQLVALDPNFPNEMLVALNLRDRRYHDVYRLDLRSGALKLDIQNPGDVAEWTADHNLQIRLIRCTKPDGQTEVRIRDRAGAPWRTLISWGANESFGGAIGFAPDNRSVLLLTSVDAESARVIQVDPATKKSTVLADARPFDITGISRHPKTHVLEAVAVTRERTEWMVLSDTVRRDFARLKELRDANFWIQSRDSADKTWIVAFDGDNAPVAYFTYDRAANNAQFLFSQQPRLESYKLASMRPISFKARDGMLLYGYLTLPVGVPAAKLPMIVKVHGGPWARDSWGFRPETQWLANRGYAVLQVEFRASTGYGKAYLNAGDREWGARMNTDLIDGKNWAVQQGYADPKKVCVFGGSYGGYATLAALAFTPGEFACGAEAFGPSNLITLLKTMPPYWTADKSRIYLRVGDPDKDPSLLASRSPALKADDVRAPLLIAQGANDARVKQAESDQMVAAMRKNRKAVEYIVFPDEGHGFARPENRLVWYAAVEQFFARNLGGRMEPPARTENPSRFRK